VFVCDPAIKHKIAFVGPEMVPVRLGRSGFKNENASKKNLKLMFCLGFMCVKCTQKQFKYLKRLKWV